jgi:hypothetical protein
MTSPPRSAIVATAALSGSTITTSIPITIAATAIERRPPTRRSMPIISGHVATTIIVAQRSAGRNGRTIYRLPKISSDRITMISRIRAISTGGRDVT